jgi:hypothetical protein
LINKLSKLHRENPKTVNALLFTTHTIETLNCVRGSIEASSELFICKGARVTKKGGRSQKEQIADWFTHMDNQSWPEIIGSDQNATVRSLGSEGVMLNPLISGAGNGSGLEAY